MATVQTFSELLELLVEEACGDLAAVAFATLERRGRLTVSGVATDSGLSIRYTRHALAILVQAHLAFHHSDHIGITTYEANALGAYALVRTGKTIKFLEERYGQGASEIALKIALSGHVKIADLEEACSQSSEKGTADKPQPKVNGNHENTEVNGEAPTNGVGEDHGGEDHGGEAETSHGVVDSADVQNGHATNDSDYKANGEDEDAEATEKRKEKIRNALVRLLKSEFIVPVSQRHFWSPSDLHFEAARDLRSTKYPGGPKGVKGKLEYAEDLKRLKREWADDEEDNENAPSLPASFKKRKVNGSRTNGVNGIYTNVDVDGDLVVRLNQEKIVMAIRTQKLADLAARYVGDTASKVYRALLQIMEEKHTRCFDELDANIYEDEDLLQGATISVSSAEILDRLDPDLDLAKELPPQEVGRVGGAINDGISGGSSSENDVSQDDDELVDKRKRSIGLINRHMRILCDDPRRFAHWTSNIGGGQWRIKFRHLSRYLVQQEIEDVAMARWGSQAVRIIRLLNARGKLEDKQISEFCFLNMKDVRVLTRAMQEKGFLEAQELPRDNSRRADRSLFIWAYDQDHVRRSLLHVAYQCMSRLIQRRDVEQKKIQPLLDKVEQLSPTDDKNKPLGKKALVALKEWEFKESKILLQLMRQDDVVALLRDFLPDHK